MSETKLPRDTILAFMRLSRSQQMRIADGVGIEVPESHRENSLTWTIAILSVIQKRGWIDKFKALMRLEQHRK